MLLQRRNEPYHGSYVVVDIDNKALSTTDKAAIKSLTIAGVETVSKDNKFDITISGAYAKGRSSTFEGGYYRTIPELNNQ